MNLIPKTFKVLKNLSSEIEGLRKDLLSSMETENSEFESGDSNESFDMFKFQESKKKMVYDLADMAEKEHFWNETNSTYFTGNFSKSMVSYMLNQIRYFSWNYRSKIMDSEKNLHVNYEIPKVLYFELRNLYSKNYPIYMFMLVVTISLNL